MQWSKYYIKSNIAKLKGVLFCSDRDEGLTSRGTLKCGACHARLEEVVIAQLSRSKQ